VPRAAPRAPPRGPPGLRAWRGGWWVSLALTHAMHRALGPLRTPRTALKPRALSSLSPLSPLSNVQRPRQGLTSLPSATAIGIAALSLSSHFTHLCPPLHTQMMLLLFNIESKKERNVRMLEALDGS